MKYLVVLIDGMADEPIETLNQKTPLQFANLPNINKLAKESELGMVQTIPAGMPPGSDVANLSIMGYAPEVYHTGRSPLEAVNIGIPLNTEDVVYRLNLVTVSEEEAFEDKIMIDHSSSDISSEEARLLLMDLKDQLEDDLITFYAGTSYRNILVEKDGCLDVCLTPPHDFLEKPLKAYLPESKDDWILELTKKSYDILNHHPINEKRRAQGLNPANCAWIWGEGKKPMLDPFREKYGKVGATISAVDLIKGIGLCAGLEAIEVAGATGTVHTDFEGKANACLKAFRNGKEFVYLHLEATDESSHQGNLEEKIKGVEVIDDKIVGYLKKYLDKSQEAYSILVLPDHPTPVRLRTHTSNPVPYLLYHSDEKKLSNLDFNEIDCESTGHYFSSGPKLMEHFMNKY